MQRYVAWQNGLRGAAAMHAGRFVEIPALQQAGLYRMEAVLRATALGSRGAIGGCSLAMALTQRGWDSGRSAAVNAVSGFGFRDDARWAVDLHFWLSFFRAGLACGRLPTGSNARLESGFADHPARAAASHFAPHCAAGYGVTEALPDNALFLWRQRPDQQTRRHGRLSIENLRRCKAEFLCDEGGPCGPEVLSASAALAPLRWARLAPQA